jgi:glucose/arabinose dehydrogenase
LAVDQKETMIRRLLRYFQNSMRPRLFALPLLLPLSFTGILGSPDSEARLDAVRLPPGFHIEIFAQAEGARSLALGDQGTVFIGTRGEGVVYAAVDRDQDYQAEEVYRIASGLNQPNGVAFRDGDLYVAEVSRILRFRDIEDRLESPTRPEVVSNAFPTDTHHGWKYIAFGPDGYLYVPVGAPCNVCERGPPYATITRLSPSELAQGNGKPEVFARGIRNTVGFDWRPGTGELWFTNNGRDWMGDDLPPDTLHRAQKLGLDFGFPFCHGSVPDPEFGHGMDCSRFAPAALELPAHVAPLGMLFYTGEMFPPRFRNQIIMAEHGSWNRSSPLGYRLSLARFEDDGTLSYEIFADGWLQGGRAWGRPVDVLQLPDGSVLVSDDRAGAVYRIWYEEQ